MSPNRLPKFAAAILAASMLLVPAIASADAPNGPPAHAQAKGKHKRDKPNFPMKGEAFTQRVEKRLGKIAAKIEKRLAKSKMSDQAKENVRAKFKAGADKIRAEANKAAADGTVTKDEAKGVRKIAREMKQEARKHKKGKRDKKGKRGKRGKRSAKRQGGPNAG